jgi:serine/threonine protein kinase
LLGYSTQVKKELCSTHYITRGYYEFPKSDMQKEFTERNKQGLDFTHEELH